MAIERTAGDLNYYPDFSNEAFYRELYGRRIYRYDAMTGAQIAIYFGDRTLIDDATAIQFALTQSKKPIYGYHSRYFDAVAGGVVIVHGRIFVNFIHQGYLRLLIKNARDPRFLEKLENEATRAEKEAKLNQKTYDGVPNSQEALINYIRKDNRDRQNQEIAQAGFVRPDVIGSTSIRIKYASDTHFDDVPVKVLTNVHFIGEGQEIQISGQPIQEMYEFIAQKVN
ncbi:MAG: hypothetical protein PVI03_05420 [Candidatus Thorarchaeota archaeon]|jgi:hypothetical protein